MNMLDNYQAILTRLAAHIEKECGLKNGAWIITLILLFIDNKSWSVDKSYLAKFYQAIDIVEKDEELKKLFQEVKENVSNEVSNGVSSELGNTENQIQNDGKSEK